MAHVIEFPQPEETYPMYWVCGECNESQSFLIRDDGYAECAHCEAVADNISVTVTIS